MKVNSSTDLRRLPLWGEQVEPHEINFEWPTQELLNKLPADLSLKALEFSKSTVMGVNISTVRCTLAKRSYRIPYRNGNQRRIQNNDNLIISPW